MPRSTQTTRDGDEIIHHEFFEGKPEMLEMLEEERANAKIARTLYELRTGAGLTQKELAERVGITTSAICRLEDADYEGPSMNMLCRIANALGCRIDVQFIPLLPVLKVPCASQTGAPPSLSPHTPL